MGSYLNVIGEMDVTKLLRLYILLILFGCVSLSTTAADEAAFNYQTTWRIAYFQGSNLFVNQRPNGEYDPAQGFVRIYDILIKYVYLMQSLRQLNPEGDTSSLGIWTEIYLINDVATQKLFIGDHILSDGVGWVLMDDADYEKLRDIILQRKAKPGDTFDGDIEKMLVSLIKNDGGVIENYDTYSHRNRTGSSSADISGNGFSPNKTRSSDDGDTAKNSKTGAINKILSAPPFPASAVPTRVINKATIFDDAARKNTAIGKKDISSQQADSHVMLTEKRDQNRWGVKLLLIFSASAVLCFLVFRRTKSSRKLKQK